MRIYIESSLIDCPLVHRSLTVLLKFNSDHLTDLVWTGISSQYLYDSIRLTSNGFQLCNIQSIVTESGWVFADNKVCSSVDPSWRSWQLTCHFSEIEHVQVTHSSANRSRHPRWDPRNGYQHDSESSVSKYNRGCYVQYLNFNSVKAINFFPTPGSLQYTDRRPSYYRRRR